MSIKCSLSVSSTSDVGIGLTLLKIKTFPLKGWSDVSDWFCVVGQLSLGIVSRLESGIDSHSHRHW